MLAAEGRSTQSIAKELGVQPRIVSTWRRRFSGVFTKPSHFQPGLLGTVLNRQVARSIHFISFLWLVLFILAHGIMVFITGIRQNTNHMFAGVESSAWVGFPLSLFAMMLVGIAWWIASPLTIRHARLAQKAGRLMVGWIKGLSGGSPQLS